MIEMMLSVILLYVLPEVFICWWASKQNELTDAVGIAITLAYLPVVNWIVAVLIILGMAHDWIEKKKWNE